MYIAVTGSKNNKDVYIYQSFRKKDGKSSSRIYKKLGKYNTLLEQFDGDNEKLMAWAKIEAAKELIRTNHMNFTQISAHLGYTSIHYFSRQFKKIVGMTPSEYASSVKAIAEGNAN